MGIKAVFINTALKNTFGLERVLKNLCIETKKYLVFFYTKKIFLFNFQHNKQEL